MATALKMLSYIESKTSAKFRRWGLRQ